MQQDARGEAGIAQVSPSSYPSRERIEEIIRRDIEGSDSEDDDWNNVLPPPPLERPAFGLSNNDWVDDLQAIEEAYESLGRGRGRASSPARRVQIEDRAHRRPAPFQRRPQVARRSARFSEDEFIRFANAQSTSSASNRSRSPHSDSSADTVRPTRSPTPPAVPIAQNLVTPLSDVQLRARAQNIEQEHQLQRRRQIHEFVENTPAELTPLQRIRFSQKTLRHDLAFVPIGLYVYVTELNRRIRVIVDMRPTGESFANFALFENSTARITEIPPRCESVNYMSHPFNVPIARHEAIVHIQDFGASFPIRILLTKDWTQDRMVLASADLERFITGVDMFSQEIFVRYPPDHTVNHDFYWHTGVLEQSPSPKARRAAQALGTVNTLALQEARGRRRGRNQNNW